jgi:hypothetical protein
MPQQYVASENRTGLEVAVKGEFPPHPDDRVRIAHHEPVYATDGDDPSTENETERRQLMSRWNQLESGTRSRAWTWRR